MITIPTFLKRYVSACSIYKGNLSLIVLYSYKISIVFPSGFSCSGYWSPYYKTCCRVVRCHYRSPLNVSKYDLQRGPVTIFKTTVLIKMFIFLYISELKQLLHWNIAPFNFTDDYGSSQQDDSKQISLQKKSQVHQPNLQVSQRSTIVHCLSFA